MNAPFGYIITKKGTLLVVKRADNLGMAGGDGDTDVVAAVADHVIAVVGAIAHHDGGAGSDAILQYRDGTAGTLMGPKFYLGTSGYLGPMVLNMSSIPYVQATAGTKLVVNVGGTLANVDLSTYYVEVPAGNDDTTAGDVPNVNVSALDPI